MCGFAAFFEYEKEFDDLFLREVGKQIHHRGPDSGGIYKEKGCALVFRRLSIIDTDEIANQPMSSNNNRYVICFNGEIYNYKEIRQELTQAGINLKTNGDTEVILEGYALWGKEILSKLEGMFAFVIWDKQEKTAFVARDAFGIKPLYVAKTSKGVYFASESRVLRKIVGTKIDEKALSELLLFRHAAGNLSNFENIELVERGSFAQISIDPISYRQKQYFDILDTFNEPLDVNESQAIELIEEALTKSVKDHLASDVGYAVQLSGGVDSSIITALTNLHHKGNLRTYSVSLKPHGDDEGQYRKMLQDKFGLEHYEHQITGIDFADSLPRAVDAMEGPSPHFGCVTLMLLCDEIRKKDKVVLTGEGADELFGGYYRYKDWKRFEKYGKIAPLVPNFLWDNIFKRYSYLKEFSKNDAAIVTSLNHGIWDTKKLFPSLIPHKDGYREKIAKKYKDFRYRLLATDQTSYLQSLLMRQDKVSMSASVETRVPFVHLPVYKVINRLPASLRIPGGTTKHLLKKFSEKHLPNELLYRRKVGLTLPLDEWLKDEKGLGRYLGDLTSSDCKIAQYGNKKEIIKLVDKFRKQGFGKYRGDEMLLSHLINMECWLRSLN